MGILEVTNVHFESTANNRIHYTGANTMAIVAGGVTGIQLNATTMTIDTAVGLSANGSVGTSGQMLYSNGTTIYWGGNPIQTTALLTVGFTHQSDSDGIFDAISGPYTPDPTTGHYKNITANGAFTFNAPTTNDNYDIVVLMTNGAGASTVTFSGFDKQTGNALTTTLGDAFMLYITKNNNKVDMTVRDVT